MQYKTEQEALEAVLSTVREIETLAKSMAPLKKDEEGTPHDQVEDQAAAGAEQAAGVPPSADTAEAAPSDGQPPMEGEAGQEEEFDPSTLSDEELQAILQMLTEELQKRQSAQGPEAGAPPAEAPAAPPPAQDQQLAMSFKLEMEKMAKSQDALRQEIETLKKSRALPVSKPAASNATSVAKVEAPVERLNKSESLEMLLNTQREGKKVSVPYSKLVADVNDTRNIEELTGAQDRVTKATGIKFSR